MLRSRYPETPRVVTQMYRDGLRASRSPAAHTTFTVKVTCSARLCRILVRPPLPSAARWAVFPLCVAHYSAILHQYYEPRKLDFLASPLRKRMCRGFICRPRTNRQSRWDKKSGNREGAYNMHVLTTVVWHLLSAQGEKNLHSLKALQS